MGMDSLNFSFLNCLFFINKLLQSRPYSLHTTVVNVKDISKFNKAAWDGDVDKFVKYAAKASISEIHATDEYKR